MFPLILKSKRSFDRGYRKRNVESIPSARRHSVRYTVRLTVKINVKLYRRTNFESEKFFRIRKTATPVLIPPRQIPPHTRPMRSSVEGLNQEIEKLVLNPCQQHTCRPETNLASLLWRYHSGVVQVCNENHFSFREVLPKATVHQLQIYCMATRRDRLTLRHQIETCYRVSDQLLQLTERA